MSCPRNHGGLILLHGLRRVRPARSRSVIAFPGGGVPSDSVVEAVDLAGDDLAGFVSGCGLAAGEQFVLKGGEERLGGGLSRAEPTRPIDWVTAREW